MWGQAAFISFNPFPTGIIPTRVGTSKKRVRHVFTCGDHPHACGDKGRKVLLSKRRLGSSPRVWGQAAQEMLIMAQKGIIPTRVGTRPMKAEDFGKSRDHPHACGDKARQSIQRFCIRGSSPRVWGQVLPYADRKLIDGIIPTRVGTRLRVVYFQIIFQDHPHACGDKFPSRLKKIVRKGSSPRVWGQVDEAGEIPINVGIIPTRVGTS